VPDFPWQDIEPLYCGNIVRPPPSRRKGLALGFATLLPAMRGARHCNWKWQTGSATLGPSSAGL
jgi:hypothetical protein